MRALEALGTQPHYRGLASIGARAALASALGGCGGSSENYSLTSTYSCLKPRVDSLTFHLDTTDYFVFDELAQRAGGGALYAKLDGNAVAVFVVFERTLSEAKRTEAAYRNGARRQEPDSPPSASEISDHIRRSQNAVVIWAGLPDDGETELVIGCLGG